MNLNAPLSAVSPHCVFRYSSIGQGTSIFYVLGVVLNAMELRSRDHRKMIFTASTRKGNKYVSHHMPLLSTSPSNPLSVFYHFTLMLYPDSGGAES